MSTIVARHKLKSFGDKESVKKYQINMSDKFINIFNDYKK